MKNAILFALAGLFFWSFTTLTTYKIDPSGSAVVWKAAKVTGKHEGTVKVQSGSFSFDNGKLSGGEIVMDMGSIRCTDLEGEYADKLVGHLKSDDFFGVATYPTAKFVATSVKALDAKGNYEVMGNLTIKKTTQPATLKLEAAEKDGMVRATGKLGIDRSKFDVRYGSNSFFDNLGDKAIYDNFDMEFTLLAKK
jgi:polyisoprenoid-binding protein YceI